MARESLASLVLGTAIAALFCVNTQFAFGQAAAPADPQLDAILEEWHQKSKEIDRLEGDHVRTEYDFVFFVARRSSGQFYYESPDKGRIDFTPDKVNEGTKFEKTNPANNKTVTLTVKPDSPERWVCDGKQVLAIDDKAMIAEQFPIPPQAQGQNIMNGPLPFLFGMEPKVAKNRYQLRVMMENKDVIDLLVVPKWKQDAENYKWARVRIERATMLPMAVQLLNPAGTGETVYTFPRIAKNPEKGILQKLLPWKDKDPFKPDLRKYDIQIVEPPAEKVVENRPAAAPNARRLTPAVIGFDFKEARALLEKAGYKVKMLRGESAKRNELVYRVQTQNPAPKTAVEAGSVIALTLYMPTIEQTGGEKPAARPVTTPKVVGTHWKDAEKALKAAGLNVKFRQGRVAATAGDVFRVYDQQPAAGTKQTDGDTVILTLYIRKDMAVK